MLFLVISIVTIFPFLVSSRNIGPYNRYSADEQPQDVYNAHQRGYYENIKERKRPSFPQYSSPPLSRRYALQHSPSMDDYDMVMNDATNVDYAVENEDIGRKDQYPGFGGWPNGFDSEGGWGSSPFFDTRKEEPYTDSHSNTDKAFDHGGSFPPINTLHNNLQPHNEPHIPHHEPHIPHLPEFNQLSQFHQPHHVDEYHEPPSYHEPQYHQPHHVDEYHEPPSYHEPSYDFPAHHGEEEHYDEPSHLTIKGHDGDTIGHQKKNKYKANFHKTNEQLFGKGGITKNKINNAVRQFGEAYVDPTLGKDTKNALLKDAGNVVKNVNDIKSHLDNNVLAIGDVFIGKKNKKRIRQKAKKILSKDVPRYVEGTLYNENSINSKVRQKTQQTLDEIRHQANLEAYEHIQKLKKGSSGDGLLSSFDKSAKKLAKTFVKKYMPFMYNKTPYEQRIGSGIGAYSVGPLMFTAATATLELISLAITGTPALYGINNNYGILG